ncbi:copper chaperone PCu(A)C [Beijerinckia sp. L45]|uniref:copper chaperone PCu(A)C n=1 Tax=Beijerinckia sp. L45 TaxID=1641855 RepID=UPI00131B1627|nr:copper chaperone PCu(A)C [Beijerinckia sp. L45]
MATTVCIPAHADDASIVVSHAWTPIQAQSGVDTALYLRIENHGKDADALTRARCPVATFTEKKVVDIGEGVPAPRTVTSVPLPASSTTDLTPKTGFVALLQTTEALPVGTSFTCTLTFRIAGSIDVAVVAATAAP